MSYVPGDINHSKVSTQHLQSVHDHYASNARTAGHAETCEKIVGHWTTKDGIGVNWPTLNGRPRCTCGAQR